MSLESNKTLGGIGAILVAIGSFFPLLSLIGIILVLIAMKGLAEFYNENNIFENALYGFIFGIIGIIAFIVLFFTVIFTGVLTGIYTGAFFALPLFIIALGVMFVFLLLQAIFYRKAFTTLSEKTGEKMFDTAGLLLLIGAILTIILVGVVLLLIAWILVAIGFFSIRAPTAQLPATAPPPAPPPAPPSAPTVSVSVEKKYCPYCGTENKSDAVFCKKCGKKITEE